MVRTTKSGATDKRHESSKANANKARSKLLEYISKGKSLEEEDSDSEVEETPIQEPIQEEIKEEIKESEPEPVAEPVEESSSSDDSDSEEETVSQPEIKPKKAPISKPKKGGKTKKIMAEIDELKNLVRGMKPIEKPTNTVNFNYEVPSYKYEKKPSFENDRKSKLKNSFLAQFQ